MSEEPSPPLFDSLQPEPVKPLPTNHFSGLLAQWKVIVAILTVLLIAVTIATIFRGNNQKLSNQTTAIATATLEVTSTSMDSPTPIGPSSPSTTPSAIPPGSTGTNQQATATPTTATPTTATHPAQLTLEKTVVTLPVYSNGCPLDSGSLNISNTGGQPLTWSVSSSIPPPGYFLDNHTPHTPNIGTGPSPFINFNVISGSLQPGQSTFFQYTGYNYPVTTTYVYFAWNGQQTTETLQCDR